MTQRPYRIPYTLHDEVKAQHFMTMNQIPYRIPSTLHDEGKVEPLDNELRSTDYPLLYKMKVRPNRWTMTLRSTDNPLLYTMKVRQNRWTMN